MLPQNKPDRIRILFDDRRLVANAGLRRPPSSGPGPSGNSSTITLTSAAGSGEHWGQDADAGRFRAGRRRLHRRRGCAARWWDGRCSRLRGQGAIHPGDLPGSFRWGHVRQLDRVSRQLLARAWAAGAGPGDSPLTIDLDSTICETYGLAKEGRATTAIPAPAAITRCWPLPPAGEVLMSRLPGQHCPWRRPLPA